jgi:hypothetical protein
VIAIEGSVFKRFRHDRAGELLQLQGKAPHSECAVRWPAWFDQVHSDGFAQKIEYAVVGGKPLRAGPFDRLRDQGAVMRSRARGCQVGAINREVQDIELQRLSQAVGGIITTRIVAVCDAREQAA